MRRGGGGAKERCDRRDCHALGPRRLPKFPGILPGGFFCSWFPAGMIGQSDARGCDRPALCVSSGVFWGERASFELGLVEIRRVWRPGLGQLLVDGRYGPCSDGSSRRGRSC